MWSSELHGRDSSCIKFGMTLDPTEVPNKASYRINFDFRNDPPKVISLEQVVENNWKVAPNSALIAMADVMIALLIDKDFTWADVRAKTFLYLVIFEVTKANKFAHMEDLNKELDAINNAANPRVSESRWIQNYMYFFLMDYRKETEKDPEYPDKLDAAMKHWQTYVASYNRDVDVFDDRDTQKTILFTVPAMIGREDIVDITRANKSMYQVIDDSKFIGQLNPNGGQLELEKGLSSIVVPRTTQYRELERSKLEMWDDIRERYNIPRVLKAKPTAAAANAASTTASSSGFNDDDFADD